MKIKKKKEKKKTATYNMTDAQLDVERRRAFDTGSVVGFEYGLCMALLAIRDEFEFGSKRLERIVDKTKTMFDAIETDHISLDDIRQTIKEETGISIELLKD